VAIALMLVLVGLLVNGIVSGASSSSAYVELVNRSFAAQTNSITETQTVQGQQLSTLLEAMASLDRQTLALRLSDLARATASADSSQQTAASPGPSGGVGPEMAAVVADRADGVSEIAAGIEGLLGLEEPTTMGVTGAPSTGATLLPSSMVLERLDAAGSKIADADRSVAALRASLARAPGHAHLIRNVFVADASLLTPDAMAALVSSLQASPSLAIVHDVALAATAITPSPLPNGVGFGLVQLPPTRSISVAVTLRNLGNVFERDVTVTASLANTAGAVVATERASGSILADGALILELEAMAVAPGTDVVLAVTLTPPAGQVDRSALSYQVGLAVAPAATGAP
jgi:hypothetical protein